MGTANPLKSYCIPVASRREPPAPREFDGEERSGPNLAQPKADWGQTRPSLALSWGQLAPTWAQLGSNMAQLGHACATWSCVGASGAEVGPKTSPLWATRARANPHQSQTTLEIGVILSVSLAAKLPRLGTFGAGGLQIMRYLQ